MKVGNSSGAVVPTGAFGCRQFGEPPVTAAAEAAATFRTIANTAVDVMVRLYPPPWSDPVHAQLVQTARGDAEGSLFQIRKLISRDDFAGYRHLIADAVEVRLIEHATRLDRRRRKSMAR